MPRIPTRTGRLREIVSNLVAPHTRAGARNRAMIASASRSAKCSVPVGIDERCRASKRPEFISTECYQEVCIRVRAKCPLHLSGIHTVEPERFLKAVLFDEVVADAEHQPF